MSQHEEEVVDVVFEDAREEKEEEEEKEVAAKPAAKPDAKKATKPEKADVKKVTKPSKDNSNAPKKVGEEKKASSKPKNYDIFPEFCIRRFIGQNIKKKISKKKKSKKTGDGKVDENGKPIENAAQAQVEGEGNGEKEAAKADADAETKKPEKVVAKRDKDMFMLSSLGYRKFQSLMDEQLKKVIEEAESVRCHSRGKPVTLLRQHMVQGALLTINSKLKTTKAELETYMDEYFEEAEKQQKLMEAEEKKQKLMDAQENKNEDDDDDDDDDDKKSDKDEDEDQAGEDEDDDDDEDEDEADGEDDDEAVDDE